MPNLTINGTVYPFPDVGSRPWAAKIISWATAVTNGMLQKSGGSFTLTAELDFGGSYGLKSLYVKSRGTNPSSAGILRLANGEAISWRNNTNAADLPLLVNASDQLLFNTKKVLPLTTDGDIYVRSGGDNERLAIGAEGTLLGVVGGALTWTSVAGTGDVVGPASSVDNTLPRFNLISGKSLQTSGVVLDDNDALSKVNFYRYATATDRTTAGELIVAVTDTSAPRAITLSNTDKVAGRLITIKDESGGAQTNAITITPQAGTIDGQASFTINQNYGSVDVYSDGTNWFTKGGESMISLSTYRNTFSTAQITGSSGYSVLISGSPTITAPGYDAIEFTSSIIAGMRVTGIGIDTSTYVQSYDSSTQITLTKNATSSSTLVSTTGYQTQTFTANTTNGNANLTSVSSLTGLCLNQPLSGTGIQLGTIIQSITAPSTITMNKTATATNTGVTITVANSRYIAVADATGLAAHQVVTGTGIAAGSYISSVTTGTYPSIFLNQNTTGTGNQSLNSVTGTALTFSQTNSTVVKASPGKVFYARLVPYTSATTSTAMLKFYDKATNPDQGVDIVISTLRYAENYAFEIYIPDGMNFSNGISFTIAQSAASDSDIHTNLSTTWEVTILYA